MNKIQGISLAIAVTLIVGIFLVYAANIQDLQSQKADARQDRWMSEFFNTINNHEYIELRTAINNNTQERNIAMGAICAVEIFALILLRTKEEKKSSTDSLVENCNSFLDKKDITNDCIEEEANCAKRITNNLNASNVKNASCNQDKNNENLIKSLVALWKEGLINEEEFMEKLDNLTNRSQDRF